MDIVNFKLQRKAYRYSLAKAAKIRNTLTK
jgi:hypothetical protein